MLTATAPELPLDPKLLDAAELKAAQSLIMKLFMEYKKQGMEGKTARKKAAQAVGATYNPPYSAEQMESLLSRSRDAIYGKVRRENRQASRKKASIAERYRAWCETNGHVAADEELAFFTGASRTTFSNVRSRLAREDGYEFTKNGSGWNVRPPAKSNGRMYSEQDVRSMMEELLQKYKN